MHNRLLWGFMVINLTEITDKEHTCLLFAYHYRPQDSSAKNRISPLHYGLFNHFEIPTVEGVQPTQVRSLTLNLLTYHTHQPAPRQKICTPRTTVSINNASISSLCSSRKKKLLIISISTYYEPFIQAINRRKST